MPDDPWEFEGFSLPTYTQVPDEFFDVVAPRLTEAELRVLIYIMRRTFGFKKSADTISLNQMIHGIKARDGRTLDAGTGMSRNGVIRGVKGLVEKRVVLVDRGIDEDGVNQINLYRLNMRPAGVVPQGDYGGLFGDRPETEVVPQGDYRSPRRARRVVPEEDPQQTEQQTVEQERGESNNSNGHEPMLPRSDAERIAWHIQDLARELHDRAPLKASATRACHLYAQSGLPLEQFLDLLQTARLRTQRYTALIKAERVDGGNGWPVKPKMAYFFGVLEDLVGADPARRRG